MGADRRLQPRVCSVTWAHGLLHASGGRCRHIATAPGHAAERPGNRLPHVCLWDLQRHQGAGQERGSRRAHVRRGVQRSGAGAVHSGERLLGVSGPDEGGFHGAWTQGHDEPAPRKGHCILRKALQEERRGKDRDPDPLKAHENPAAHVVTERAAGGGRRHRRSMEGGRPVGAQLPAGRHGLHRSRVHVHPQARALLEDVAGFLRDLWKGLDPGHRRPHC
mmetsp:Transcript_25527/g.59402  ORF Transcript_25527/g.59402 Transcript_25527/m.59402 type:complete len:220 (+) Transcript_25527:209-868(+)